MELNLSKQQLHKKLKTLEEQRKYAWKEYYMLLNFTKNLCTRINDYEQMLTNVRLNKGVISNSFLNWVLELGNTAHQFFECSICLNPLTYDDKINKVVITKCGHMYHNNCIMESGIMKPCPNCMSI